MWNIQIKCIISRWYAIDSRGKNQVILEIPIIDNLSGSTSESIKTGDSVYYVPLVVIMILSIARIYMAIF